jgi:hypothetical protein
MDTAAAFNCIAPCLGSRLYSWSQCSLQIAVGDGRDEARNLSNSNLVAAALIAGLQSGLEQGVTIKIKTNE